MNESGISVQQDFISGNLLGRQSSYLRKALSSGRGNLVLYPNMLAKRVVFEGDLRARGVEVSHSRLILDAFILTVLWTWNLLIFQFIFPGRSIIVQQHKHFRTERYERSHSFRRAFQSPQLLMVSGIGPRAQLEAHNITVRADRPGVGE
jgi:choline dehydrogenase